jgi:hypothetical protein
MWFKLLGRYMGFDQLGVLMVRLGIEFLELESNSNSIYKYQGKKLCLGVEFFD